MRDTEDPARRGIQQSAAFFRFLGLALTAPLWAIGFALLGPEPVWAAEIVTPASSSDPITFAVNSLKTFLATIATVVVAASIGWKAVVAWSAGSVEAQREAQRFALQSLVVYGLVMAFNFGLMQNAVEYLVNAMGGRA
ncbi:MAG: hypothetical protein F4Z80_00705 [Chloroflexi bacterium]|nr:hypothetical protein [Chloroflexota bacterium]